MRIPGIRDYVIDKLKFMFEPNSIAIIGASREPEKIGYQCLKNLINGGYEGRIYPINPNTEEILGLKSFTSLKDISDEIDLALIVIPAKFIKKVIEDCIEKKVKVGKKKGLRFPPS